MKTMMNGSNFRPRPRVLIVDDEPSEQRPLQLELDEYVDTDVSGPEEVKPRHLLNVDLILADYKLQDWIQRDTVGTPITRQPKDGFALIAVLRAHIAQNARPTAFAMRTGHPEEIASPLPRDRREHAVAQRYNLEWVFAKAGADGVSAVRQIAALATAVHALPDDWPRNDAPEETLEVVHRLLAFPRSEDWGPRAWEDVEACHPPIHELSAGTHGLAFLRWLLHRILPYPCFLWNSQRIAARLRTSHEAIRSALEDEHSSLRKLFEPFRYTGVLESFLGPRWWRTGVEAFLWHMTRGNSFDARAVHDALAEMASMEFKPDEYSQPVICLDYHLRPLPGLYESRDVVRIQPDDWPPYAEEAWATLASAREEANLRAIVVGQDRYRLVER